MAPIIKISGTDELCKAYINYKTKNLGFLSILNWLHQVNYTKLLLTSDFKQYTHNHAQSNQRN